MKIHRQYIPTYGADSEAIRHGLNWLLKGNHRLAIHVPSLEQIHGGSVLTEQLGKDVVSQFRKSDNLKLDGKNITVITDRKQPEIRKDLQVLSCWPVSQSLEKLEEKYHISDILVIPWNFKEDIEKWKLKHLPDIYQKYTPLEPQEF